KWRQGIFSGTADLSVPVANAGGHLQIGDLPAGAAGSHDAGIHSGAYNLKNNGYAQVQLTQAPAGGAYATFSIAYDSDNLYRWLESGGSLLAQTRVNGQTLNRRSV